MDAHPAGASTHPLLEAALNLARFHDQHERFYATAPLESAPRLQRHARALLALAEGERHRIISNDWLAAHMQSLIGTSLARAADMIERVDLTPAALRADLAGPRVAPRRLYAAAEVLSRAADLCGESAQLVHDNDRRWRVTRSRAEQVVQAMTAEPRTATGAGGSASPE